MSPPECKGESPPLRRRESDHFIFLQRSGGHLHGDISLNTIIYLEEQKKGGLLHLDPPVHMRGRDFKFSLQ